MYQAYLGHDISTAQPMYTMYINSLTIFQISHDEPEINKFSLAVPKPEILCRMTRLVLTKYNDCVYVR